MKTLKIKFFDCGKGVIFPSPSPAPPKKIEIYASLTYRYHVLKAQNDPLFTGPPYLRLAFDSLENISGEDIIPT